MTNIVMALATISTGLMAGLFFAWSFSVNNGLANVGDILFIKTFQSMNKSIQNPFFSIIFIGAAFLTPWALYLNSDATSSFTFLCLLAATIVYLVGSVGVTFFANLPLNESLDAFDADTASSEDIIFQRRIFERKWNLFNTIRTISSLLAFVLLVICCVYPSI
ncbi:anthrone oxygenase family protein [uncultured Kriegella sp.]|uniref:anthrone oxygenase family protein n=1 Tax=uncultured Kriegella sp. TaxID=1798910 RepID=UPI0030DC95B7|tara:strand:+ start:376992 stop:377480 length:489 start_codon:yes stop_codon:yes gene_type:complete